MNLLGELALWLAAVLALWSAAASLAGAGGTRPDFAESGARALSMCAAAAAVSAVALCAALLEADLSLRYVAAHGGLALPRIYRLAAFWAGRAGALLGGGLALALAGAAATAIARRTAPALAPLVTAAIATAALLVLAVAALRARPFAPLTFPVPDGRGLHPWLRTAPMAAHPPLLFAGLAAAAVPLALGIAALVRRAWSEPWRTMTRAWALLSWLLLAAAMLAGMRGAYLAPGGSSSWMWYPLDSGVGLPWLALAALLYALGAGAPGEIAVPRLLLAALAAGSALVVAMGTQAGVAAGSAAYSYAPASPLLLVLVAAGALAAASALVWRHRARARSAAAHERNALARVGALLAHAGVALAVAGAIAAAAGGRSLEVQLGPGEAREAIDPFGARWRFVSTGLSRITRPDAGVYAIGIDATGPGGRHRTVTSERLQFTDARGAPLYEPVMAPALIGGWSRDVLLRMRDIGDGERVTMSVSFLPLVRLVWVGAALALLGAAIMLLPRTEARET